MPVDQRPAAGRTVAVGYTAFTAFELAPQLRPDTPVVPPTVEALGVVTSVGLANGGAVGSPHAAEARTPLMIFASEAGCDGNELCMAAA